MLLRKIRTIHRNQQHRSSTERQVASLLAVMGPSTNGVLRNLVYPEKPKDKSLDEISTVLEERFTEKKVEIAERFRFYTAVQESETIAQFVSCLKKLARYCNFGDKLNDMIRDRLVCGIKDRNTQKKLLVESGLTLEKAIKVAIADEAANKSVAELAKARGLGPTNEVHRMKATSSKSSESKTNKPVNLKEEKNVNTVEKEIIQQKNANSSMQHAINVTNKDTLQLF